MGAQLISFITTRFAGDPLDELKPEETENIEKIKKWFQEVDENSEMIIDDKWEFKNIQGNSHAFIVSNNNLPFEVGLYIMNDVIQITVFTNMATKTMTLKEQRDIFRDLLIRNNKDLFVKYYLAGVKNTLALRTEINQESLSKREFNDALQALIYGTKWLLDKMGGLENVCCDETDLEKGIKELITKLLEQGYGKHDIINRIIQKRDMEPEDATERVFAISKERDAQK